MELGSPFDKVYYQLASGQSLVGGGGSYERSTRTKRTGEEISAEYLEIHFGVNQWLKERGEFLIDADANTLKVDTLDPQQYISRAGALRDKIKKLGRGGLISLEQEVMHDTLEAAEAYLFEKYVRDPRDTSEKLPLPLYYRKLMGDALMPISLADREEPKDEYLRLLSVSGYRFNPGDEESVREATRQYDDDHRLEPVLIKPWFRNFDRGLNRQVDIALGDPDAPDLDYDLDDSRYDEAQWFCWERVENGRRRVDLNKAHLGEWTMGDAERYALHEVEGHLKMFDRQFKAVEEGTLDKGMQISVIPSPLCWLGELMGQTLDIYAGIILSTDGQLSVNRYRMYMRAKAHAGWRMGVDGADLETAVTETMPYALHKTEDQIRSELIKIRDDALWSTYGIVYGRSCVDGTKLARELDASGRIKVLRSVYRQPLTRDQFWRLLPNTLVA